MNRKRFLAGSAGGVVFLWLQACGGGGGDDAGSGNGGFPPDLDRCSATEISANHGHALPIAVADLDSPAALTYDIQGSADHNHRITLTVTQLQQLKSGATVTVTSTTTTSPTSGTHAHQVTVGCE